MTSLRKPPVVLGLATLAALGLAAVQPAHAQISGFAGGSGTGATQYTLNHSGAGPAASISGGTLQLTQATNDSDNSVWYNTPQSIKAFSASFTYTAAAGATADGFTFALQNAGLTALGAGGGSIGYSGTDTGFSAVTPSAAIAFDFYNTGNDAHTGVAIPNGTIGLGYGVLSNGPAYLNTGLLIGGGAINVSLAYNGQQLLTTLVQGTNTYSYTDNVDLPLTVGGSSAYIGFTGATGGLNAGQQISNYVFTSLAAPTGLTNITSPTDSIRVVDGTGPVPAGGDTPTAEGVANVIDRSVGTKYLNFTGPGSGFVITPGKGSTIVTALELTSANDTPGRDPATFSFLGSNNGGTTFTQIASGSVPTFADRYESQYLTFANSTAYTTYCIFNRLVVRTSQEGAHTVRP
jgi:hypothetical protein